MKLAATEIRSRLEDALAQSGIDAEAHRLSTEFPSALRDQVLSLASVLAEEEQAPGALLRILLDMDLPAFIAMAADSHCHFAIERALRATVHRLAAASPIFRADTELVACPTGDMDGETLMLFFDRVLAAIAQEHPSAVRLRLDGFDGSADDLKRPLAVFEDELAALRIPLR